MCRGMSLVTSHAHYKYFVTFSDKHTHFTWIYLMQSKYDVFSMFQKNL